MAEVCGRIVVHISIVSYLASNISLVCMCKNISHNCVSLAAPGSQELGFNATNTAKICLVRGLLLTTVTSLPLWIICNYVYASLW